MTKNRIKLSITNDNYEKYIDTDLNSHGIRRISISNTDWYSHPDRKYYYNMELDNLSECFYIAFGRVKGIFKNIKFSSTPMETYFDLCYFSNIIFENCIFDKVEISCCKFDNCKFINCTGNISSIRDSTFKKNCLFQNTSINIKYVDGYMYLNSERYNYGVTLQ